VGWEVSLSKSALCHYDCVVVYLRDVNFIHLMSKNH